MSGGGKIAVIGFLVSGSVTGALDPLIGAWRAITIGALTSLLISLYLDDRRTNK